MDSKSTLVIGANGQLGKALMARYPNAQGVDMAELDISSPEALQKFDWSSIRTVLNAAAFTNVDAAETPEGRISAWQANAVALRNLAVAAAEHNLTLVHISTDYVFDGESELHTEDEPVAPLSVYGSSKAAGDIAVSMAPNHYILRISWLIGEGKNFVRTMIELGKKGVNPTVVSDQIGRLTFTSELVRAIDYLLESKAAYGTYNVTNDGPSKSWSDITRDIFRLANMNNTVVDTTTADYYAGKEYIAPRPLQSTLDLTKLQKTGFKSRDWQDDLAAYIKKELIS